MPSKRNTKRKGDEFFKNVEELLASLWLCDWNVYCKIIFILTGVYGFPHCPGEHSVICDYVRKLLNEGAYVRYNTLSLSSSSLNIITYHYSASSHIIIIHHHLLLIVIIITHHHHSSSSSSLIIIVTHHHDLSLSLMINTHDHHLFIHILHDCVIYLRVHCMILCLFWQGT